MIYLYCERCHEEHVFLPAEERPPFDVHMSMCDTCGFSFGYREITSHANGRIDVQTRPVLSPEVVAAGLDKYRRERIERLRARGLAEEHDVARRMFDATEGNLSERRRLTSSSTGVIDPALADKILRPKVPPRE